MARWRWLSSTAWSKERSSSRSKARLTAPHWSKPKTIRPERGKQSLLPHSCAHRRPARNPTPGSVSTAKLAPFFAATDTIVAEKRVTTVERRGLAGNTLMEEEERPDGTHVPLRNPESISKP